MIVLKKSRLGTWYWRRILTAAALPLLLLLDKEQKPAASYFPRTLNPDITSCTNGVKREGIMLATATNPTSAFTKNNSFATIYAPTGIGYDENDNWRDPFVVWDAAGNNWMMLIAARKNHNGSWRGVIAKYTSSDLLNWSYQSVFYDGGSTNYFNMECPGIFHFGGYYYLIFSDQSISSEKQKYVHYRKSTSVNGPWSLPSGPDRIDSNAFYAGKAVPEAYGDAYLFGWCHTRSGGTDNGSWAWGGNLVTHKYTPYLMETWPPLFRTP